MQPMVIGVLEVRLERFIDGNFFWLLLMNFNILLRTVLVLILSGHAVFLKKIASLLRNIEHNFYGNLKKTLAALNSIKNNPMVLSGVNPPKNIGTHGFVTA